MPTFEYDAKNRLSTVNSTVASYKYNGLGERIRKQTNSTRIFFWDRGRKLIGEYDELGNPIQEHIYFGMVPVAVIDATSQHFVHVDHLGSPRAITDGNDVLWRWESDAFGTTNADEDPDGDGASFVYPMRFPGQFYDSETGQHYNYFRDYDSSLGRYVQTDPLGLDGGLATY